MRRRRDPRGQGLVEFSFAIIIFLTVFVGTIDMARGVFTFNGVADAARQITRETSVHPGSGAIGTSAETVAMVAAQQGLVQGLSVTSYACVDLAGDPVSGTCKPGDWVRVSVEATFYPVLPLLTALGPIVLTSVSSAEIQ
jgi:Flp pilus assembly protein TadG